MMKRASSLILVVVIISAIITVVFGAQRLALVQYNQANRDEDNIAALYAAKAGIEDGLLRFRHERNAEIPDPELINLTTGEKGGIVNSLDTRYELTIDYKVAQIGDFAFPATQPDPKPILAKDGFLELTGFQPSSSQYYLRAAFKFLQPGTTSDCTDANALVQIQRIVDGATSPYIQETVKRPSTNIYDSKNSTNIIVNPLSNNPTTTTVFRIRPYYCDVAYAFSATNEQNGSGGGANDPNFDGLTTNITSNGYFGASKRTLVAKINRISGQLIGIFDFNVYSGQGSIKP